MSAETDIHVALIAKAETVASALGYQVLWPRLGGDKPEGEHLRVAHLPNDNAPADLSSQAYERQGFLFVTLVSPLGISQAEAIARCDDIATRFPRGKVLTENGTSVKIMGHTIRQGRQEGERWETPIRISYWSMT